MKKNLPFIPLFPLDFQKISEAKLSPKSKSLFDLSAPGQGLIINIDLEDNVIYMVPAYNKGDSEGKELDKFGKPLPQFIRSLTPRVRGMLNPQSTGGDLHKQVDQLYGLGGKPRLGMGIWKDEKEGIEELLSVSTLQMFSIRWRRVFREYFKLRVAAHFSHAETLLREIPYQIFKYIIDVIYKELNLAPISIEANPAIPAIAKAHFETQKEWEQHHDVCLKLLFINLTYQNEEKLIAEIMKEHHQEEKEFKDNTDLEKILEEAKLCVSLLQAARDGDILAFRAALSNIELYGIPLQLIYLIENKENALMFAAKIGHVGIIREINDYLEKHNNQYCLLELMNRARKTPLIMAVENGHLEAVNLLMQDWMNPSHIFYAAIAAVKKGYVDILKAIFLKFQNIQEKLIFGKDENARNLLMLAVIAGRLEVVKLIFEISPQVKSLNEIDSEWNDVLTLSIKNKQYQLIEYLYQIGANFKSAFLLSLQKKDWDTSKLIMHYYFTYSNPAEVYLFLYLQLSDSIMKNDRSIFNFLLDLIPQKFIGQTHTILNLAALYDGVDLIEDYLKFVSDKSPITDAIEGLNPLSSAWVQGSKSSVNLLLDKQIITLTDFHYAVFYAEDNLLHLMMPNIPPTLPYISIAMLDDHVEAIDLLFKKLPHVDHRLDDRGTTLLILAIKKEALDVAKYLLRKRNADPCQADAKGHTPLIIAARTQELKILELILNSADHPKSELLQIFKSAKTYKNRKMLKIITQHSPWLVQPQPPLSQNPQTFISTDPGATTTGDSTKSAYNLSATP